MVFYDRRHLLQLKLVYYMCLVVIFSAKTLHQLVKLISDKLSPVFSVSFGKHHFKQSFQCFTLALKASPGLQGRQWGAMKPTDFEN